MTSSKGERLAGEENSKSLQKSTGPYKVLAENRDTVNFFENGVPNMISIKRSTDVPSGERKGWGQGKQKMTQWRGIKEK